MNRKVKAKIPECKSFLAEGLYWIKIRLFFSDRTVQMN